MLKLVPTKENKTKITQYMNETFEERKLMRKNAKSAAEIITEFPRLLDFSGDMVIINSKN